LSEDGGSLSAALKGIDYAIARGAKVINASWGGSGCSQSLRQKISEVAERNVLFVTAAGNSGNNIDRSPEYPAAFNLPLQITVGALGESLAMANYSNYSSTLVHLFAPGSLVVSTVPGNSYAAYSGTSMATPFVAGASAVLLGSNPNMSLSEVRERLFHSVVTNSNYSNFTSGRLNLGAAINALGRAP
jgi:thermitase